MRVTIFSNKPYVIDYLDRANHNFNHELSYTDEKLNEKTCRLAQGSQAVCAFVNDLLNAPTLQALSEIGIKLIALRCAGFNNVDLTEAAKLGIKIVRVPAYSPYAVAEHTLALILSLNRNVCRARSRIREGNFSLEGLMGFDLNGCPVGIIGTGQIGIIVAKILKGFGCELFAFDPRPNQTCIDMGVRYVDLDVLFASCYIITLHCPLMPQTHHIIDASAVEKMRDCVMLINTSRGALIDTKAVIEGLKSHKIGYLGLDVYEEEEALFFEDLSNEVIQDDVFARLLMFPNVIVTGHQAFFTSNAIQQIAYTTLKNISQIEAGQKCENELTSENIKK